MCANVFPPLKQYIFLLTDMIFPVLCCLLEMALEIYKGIHTKTAVNVTFVTFATCVCYRGPCCWSFLVFYVVFLVLCLCCLHLFCVLFPMLPSVYWMSLRVFSEVYVLSHSVTPTIPSLSRTNYFYQFNYVMKFVICTNYHDEIIVLNCKSVKIIICNMVLIK